jgi:hypothetical protein
MPCGWKELYLSSCRFQRESYGMSAKLILIALTAFLGVSQLANAGVMLFVHFGDNAPDSIQLNEIQSNFTPGAHGNLTANIYLHLTGGASMYGYRFSVRYDNDLLQFVNREQFRPNLSASGGPIFEPDKLVEFELDPLTGTPKSPDPDPVAPSSVNSSITNAKDLYRFNGIINSSDNLVQTGFYKVATLTFNLNVPQLQLPAGRTLILPGAFDVLPKNPPFFSNDVLRDTVLTEDVEPNGKPVILGFTPFGGAVSNSAIPEPSSVAVFGILGVIAFVLHKRRSSSTIA